MNRSLHVLVVVAGLAVAQEAAGQGRFVNLPYTATGIAGTAALWLPANYDPSKKWPLVVYLHGGSQRGDHGGDATGAWLNDIPIVQVIRKDPGRVAGLVLIPRCPVSTVWIRHPDTEQVPDCCASFVATKTAEAYPAVDAAFDKVVGTYAIDPDRVTLTGISLGGHGSLRYGALRAERFAGIVSISGFGALRDAARLAEVPMWVFHGDADTTVPIAFARTTAEVVRKAGGNVRVTEFPGLGHSDVGDKVYGNPEVMTWLFSQRRKPQSR